MFSCSARIHTYPKRLDPLCGQLGFLFYGSRGTCPGTKRPAPDSDHSPSSSVEVENKWSCTSIHPTCFRCMNRETFTYVLWDTLFCLWQYLNLLKPTCYVMHHQQFNIQQMYALPTLYLCFVFIWEQTATCATYSINWLVFITEMKSVYSAVRTGSLNKAVCASSVND